jgi:hypothetical protein
MSKLTVYLARFVGLFALLVGACPQKLFGNGSRRIRPVPRPFRLFGFVLLRSLITRNMAEGSYPSLTWINGNNGYLYSYLRTHS